MSWNLDIAAAPKDAELWLASRCAQVIKSYWIKKEGRWAGFSAREEPIAWQLYQVPLHPHHMLPADLAPVAEENIPIIDDCGSGQ